MITPVILCGGSGTRLWPLSRQSYPKQFTRLLGEQTLFQQAALRSTGRLGQGLDFAPPVVMTNADFRFYVTEQLHDVGIDPGAVLIEPEMRNTAPAVLAAALHVAAADPEAVLLISPSDHAIPDNAAFHAALRVGLGETARGRLVTFGIRPTRPETAYGYLELAGPAPGDGAAQPLRRFVEKPDVARASQMIEAGSYLWNAGIFLARAADLVAAYRAHAAELLPPVEAALAAARPDLGFLRLDPAAWAGAENISIDFAVMEKAKALSVVPFDAGWSDLGDWNAVWRGAGPDARGNALAGEATAIDCGNVLLRSEKPGLRLVGIGLENVMAIAMPDAVLVADLSRAQDVKLAVETLKAQGVAQATTLPRDNRPWGWFESLAQGPRFQVKRIVVKPGATLSLQSHVHRAEHWIVVEGTAKVTIEDKVTLVTENQSVYIPLGARHRMENPGKLPMVLIEVQTGAYLGEDDIVRYEDAYARGQGARG